ncbi:MAG: sigma-70 family RNA polymerase sigma factor [Myxococcaceae bacterium]|nr:sigma-70 family RNA polymerase sigma factor [Myxococcaceae bacterium]
MTSPTDNLAVSEGGPSTTTHRDSGTTPAPAAAERERLAAMFEAHYDIVWRVLRRVGLSDATAEDGAQQVFLIASRRMADIELGKERAFLCATAVRVAGPLRARPKRESPVEDAPEQVDDATPHDLVQRKQQRALLDRLLAQLDEDVRTVVVLAELEGLTKREVAEALGIPEGTAASRLRRGREELATLMRRWKEGQR